MENENVLDPIEKIIKSKFSKLSFRTFLMSLSSFAIFFVLSILNIGSSFVDTVFIILILGFVLLNVAGLIFTLLSLIKGEPNSVQKNVGAIGNIIFFFVMLGMISFVIMDLVTWF